MRGERKPTKFIVSRMYMTLFIGFVSMILVTMAIAQRGMDEIYRIANFQILFAVVGFMLIFMFIVSGEVIFDKKNIYEPDALDPKRGWLLYGLLGMAVARILGAFIVRGGTLFSSIWFDNLIIVSTSAVFEEPFFCALGLLFYLVFKKYIKDENIAILLSSLPVAAIFAAIHLGVYNLSWDTMLVLAIARVVFNMVFLKTRTLLAPTTAHLFHNFLIMIGF